MERRVLLAIALSFLVLYVYQALVVKPQPKPVVGQTPAASQQQASSANAAAASSPASQAAAPPETPGGPTAAALVGETSERDVRVETRDLIAVFTNRGARLKSWRLKRYLDQNREPQELVETHAPGQALPFSLRTDDGAITSTVNTALYTVAGAPSGPIEGPTDIRFEYRDNAGVVANKQFHFEPGSYVVTTRVSVSKDGQPVAAAIQWGPAVGDVGEVSRYSQRPEAILMQSGKVQRLAPKDLAKQSVFDGEFRYVGVDDNYFMTAALPSARVRVTYQPVTIPAPDPKEPPRELVAYTVDPPERDANLQFFVGPKDFDVLAALGPDMTRAINFGIFSAIVVPLLRSLKWVNSYVGNYGWSIVILTIIINVILLPLSHKSIVSMRRMQEIQPQMKAIQDRYAKYKTTDPEKQKMNQELMALYREKGVNPAGGCVPMLLTIPVLYAMWAMLSTAIELRGAPFVGWIHDLTAHDPYYVTPILMGVTQVWQMKMTPSTGADPAQQKMMMYIMPVMMTVMFFWMPAGALIYYVVSNLWRIGQQYLTNQLIGPPNVRAARPPAERRMKRVGGGRTDAAARE